MDQGLLQRLLDQAFLYDDPSAYQAGVHAAWRALTPAQTATLGTAPEQAPPLLAEAPLRATATG